MILHASTFSGFTVVLLFRNLPLIQFKQDRALYVGLGSGVMIHSILRLASRKNMRLKCTSCLRLLPSAHFPHQCGPSHTIVCLSCKRMCVGCGMRQIADNFPEESLDRCSRCIAKRHVAATNVYYRYPILQYKACPYSVSTMRAELRNETNRK